MANTYDVIVVGVGAMGASACWHLARRGARVLGLERFGIPHDRGSSHGHSRMIRLAYYEHPDYVPLLRRAYDLWHELQQSAGQQLINETGGLYLGTPDSDLISGSLASARQHGLAHEPLDRQALAQRFPQFDMPDDFVGVFEHRAGYLLPERCIAAMAEQALRQGARLHAHEPVRAWRADAGEVVVCTDQAEYHAGQLVFCGGAWSTALLGDLFESPAAAPQVATTPQSVPDAAPGGRLRVTRQVMGWVWPIEPKPFELGRLPVWAIGHPDGLLHYGFPILPDGLGLKVALHAPGLETDPDQVQREPMPGDEETFRSVLRRSLPQADGPLLAMRVCLYTNSPDGHFLLDRHPRHPRVTLACGFSGHGFKFASVIGEVLADLALGGSTQHPVGFLRLPGGTKARV